MPSTITKISNWAVALWNSGNAVSSWRAHYSEVREVVFGPGDRYSQKWSELKTARDAASTRYGADPSLANHAEVTKANAALARHEAEYAASEALQLSVVDRMEKTLNPSLLRVVIAEAEAELKRRHAEAISTATKLATEFGVDATPITAAINATFARRAENLDLAARCTSNSLRRDAEYHPRGFIAAHGALENALTSA